ncbi:hypothetical protein GJ496_005909 [Pomphorhynchus laevis]|nr:hypothetical protein GJ496_005909 [Pomphorhynchus laevis]
MSIYRIIHAFKILNHESHEVCDSKLDLDPASAPIQNPRVHVCKACSNCLPASRCANLITPSSSTLKCLQSSLLTSIQFLTSVSTSSQTDSLSDSTAEDALCGISSSLSCDLRFSGVFTSDCQREMTCHSTTERLNLFVTRNELIYFINHCQSKLTISNFLQFKIKYISNGYQSNQLYRNCRVVTKSWAESGLFVMYSNLHRNINKFDEVKHIATLYNPDIIALSEIWFYTNIDDALVSIPKYELLRIARANRRGGEVVLSVREKLS